MDLMLNITNTSNPYEKVKKKSTQDSKKKLKSDFANKPKADKSIGFNFQFTKNDKVKAVVNKRRVKNDEVEPKANVSNAFKFDFIKNDKVKAVVNKRRVKNDEVEPKANVSNGFKFEFIKNDKVKSVVNRRSTKNNDDAKKNKTINTDINKPTNFVMRPKFPVSEEENENFVKKNYVMRPKDDDDIADTSKLNEHNEPNIDISLNLTTSNVNGIVNKVKPAKLSRTERFNKEREEKLASRDRKNVQTLSQDEINKGIKKFSKQAERPKKQKKPPICSDIGTKILGQRFVKPIVEKVFTGCSLATLNLHPHLVKDLADVMNITELTRVQQRVIPKALEGHDIVVRSQTGSGKTLAYAIPIVQKLQEIRPKITRNCGIMALIIVPTRELALQTYEFVLKILKPFTWIVPGYLCGGEKRKSEKARLRKGINILVATSGRLLDHILNTDSCKLDKLKFLILDEADRLLEFGYERDVSKIVHTIDEHKRNAKVADEFRPVQSENAENNEEVKLQILMLSATLTSAIQKLAGLALKNPIFIDNSEESQKSDPKPAVQYDDAVDQALKEDKLILPENLTLNYIVVHPKLRLPTLSGLLVKVFKNRKTKVLIFVATTEMVNFLHDLLNEALTMCQLDEDVEPNESETDNDPLLLGVKFFKLHGSMTQIERGGVFNAFRKVNSGILLTTDVAGRGIDVPEVDLVVQYSPPQSLSDFVHRVGRTARAGKSGTATLFLAADEVEFIKLLEDKRLRISQEILEDHLKSIKEADNVANTVQEAVSNLQRKFEDLIEDDEELRDKACKAYTSWVRNYAAFPKEFKSIFNIKKAHKGHFAKSFALKDPPSTFITQHTAPKPSLPINRLTYTTRDEKKPIEKSDNPKRKHNLSSTVSDGSRVVNKFRDPTSNHQKDKFNNNNKRKNNSSSNNWGPKRGKSMAASISEFDSGIPEKKRRT